MYANYIMEIIHLSKSTKPDKKFMIKIGAGAGERNKTVHFGNSKYDDYTIHKDPERMKRYIMRHQKRESWGKDGIKTAGFWAKNLLWNLPSLKESIKETEKKFGIKIIRN